jgi:hypothetical protein
VQHHDAGRLSSEACWPTVHAQWLTWFSFAWPWLCLLGWLFVIPLVVVGDLRMGCYLMGQFSDQFAFYLLVPSPLSKLSN